MILDVMLLLFILVTFIWLFIEVKNDNMRYGVFIPSTPFICFVLIGCFIFACISWF